MCKTDDYRGISLASVAYKAMCSVVHRRLLHMVEEKQLVAEEQGGFRKGRGSANDIGIPGADEGSDRKRDVCQVHRLQKSI